MTSCIYYDVIHNEFHSPLVCAPFCKSNGAPPFCKSNGAPPKCKTMLDTRRLSILYRRSLNQTTNHSKATLIPLLYRSRGGDAKKCLVSKFCPISPKLCPGDIITCLLLPAWRHLPAYIMCAAPCILITCIYNDVMATHSSGLFFRFCRDQAIIKSPFNA